MQMNSNISNYAKSVIQASEKQKLHNPDPISHKVIEAIMEESILKYRTREKSPKSVITKLNTIKGGAIEKSTSPKKQNLER